MSRRLAIGLALVLGLAAALALVVFLSLRRLDPEALGRRVVAEAEASLGIRLEAAEARLEPLGGLRLRSVTARGATPAGQLEGSLGSLVLRPRWWHLLTGRVVIADVLLESPRLEVRQRSTPERGGETTRERRAPGAKRGPSRDAPEESGRWRLEVQRAELSDGLFLLLGADGEEELRLEGLAVELAELSLDPAAGPTGLAGFSGRGRLAADSLVLDQRRFEALSGQLEVAEDRLVARELGLTTREGRFVVRELEILDSRPPWRWRAEVDGDPLEIGRMIGGGEATGSLHLEVEARGTETTGRRGSGALTLDAGSLPAAPWVLRVAELLGRPELVGSAYEETRVEFTLEDDRVEIAPFELVGELVGLEGRGTAYLSGPLDLRLTVRTRREGLSIEDVPPQVLDLVTTGDGWVTVPLRVGGVLDDPVVKPDTKALGRVLRDSAKSRLGRALGGGG